MSVVEIEKKQLYNKNLILVANKSFHHGVIGIVASKILDKYYKPTIIMEIKENEGIATASCRSIEGLNIVECLNSVSDILVKYGGHSGAAGFTIKIENIEEFYVRIDRYIEENFEREVVMVGASTGTDAHTVGIDAIMNMKGYAGHYGLERYKGVRAYNLGSQVPNEEFIKKAIELKADALLVSQTVTQKDVHIENLTNLVELLEAEGLRDKIILIAGGARITNDLAKELGYDAGFGPGKYADDVATFILKEMVQRGMNK